MLRWGVIAAVVCAVCVVVGRGEPFNGHQEDGFLVEDTSAIFLSGYVCPTCPSAGNDPATLLAEIPSTYKLVHIAFAGWTTSGSVVQQFNTASFTLTPTMVANLKSGGRRKVYISIGGGAAPALDCAADTAFQTNFATSLAKMVTAYGFDGVDLDIENREGDPVGCANVVLGILTKLFSSSGIAGSGLGLSMAPQMTSLYPEYPYITSAFNPLVPLVSAVQAGKVPNLSAFTFIQPQMYNTWAGVETLAYATKYAGELHAGFSLSDNKYHVQVPANQLLLGYPASSHGAGSGYIAPTAVATMARNLVSNGTIAGVMTWSIGWDQQNNWAFAKAMMAA